VDADRARATSPCRHHRSEEAVNRTRAADGRDPARVPKQPGGAQPAKTGPAAITMGTHRTLGCPDRPPETASLLLVREGLTVVEVASSLAEALRQARALRPDPILVGIGLGDESALSCPAPGPRRSGRRSGARSTWASVQLHASAHIAASRGSASMASRGGIWASAMMAGAQPREILG
jgi:hypothetical protein